MENLQKIEDDAQWVRVLKALNNLTTLGDRRLEATKSLLYRRSLCESTEGTHIVWDSWSIEDKKKLLEMYLIISQKETYIFDLIYQYHGCDSWEEIFRDYDPTYLKDKATGVKVAINEITEIIEENEENEENEYVP